MIPAAEESIFKFRGREISAYKPVFDRVDSIFKEHRDPSVDIEVEFVDSGKPDIKWSRDHKSFSITISAGMSTAEVAMYLGIVAAEAYPKQSDMILNKSLNNKTAQDHLNRRWTLLEHQLEMLHKAICDEANYAPEVVKPMNRLIGRGGESIPNSNAQFNALINLVKREFHTVTGEMINNEAITSIYSTLSMRSEVFNKISALSRGEEMRIATDYLSRLIAAESINESGANIRAMALGGVMAHVFEIETGEECSMFKQWMPNHEEFSDLLENSPFELVKKDAPRRHVGM